MKIQKLEEIRDRDIKEATNYLHRQYALYENGIIDSNQVADANRNHENAIANIENAYRMNLEALNSRK